MISVGLIESDSACHSEPSYSHLTLAFMYSSRFTRISAGVLFLLLQLSLSCHAQALEAPTGRVILTVTGEIGVTNAMAPDAGNDQPQAASAQFDLAQLEALGLMKVATETPWTDGLVQYEGVLVRDLLEFLKADGAFVNAAALDDYIVKLPIEDFLEYDVIIATRIDGKPMRVRQNGPLWIIYPWTDVSELRRPHFYSRSVWQLKTLTVLP